MIFFQCGVAGNTVLFARRRLGGLLQDDARKCRHDLVLDDRVGPREARWNSVSSTATRIATAQNGVTWLRSSFGSRDRPVSDICIWQS